MLLLVMTMVTTVMAAQTLKFSISNGYEGSGQQKTIAEKNITALLNSLHEAAMHNGTPEMVDIKIVPKVREQLMALWEYCPFRCADMTNVYSCVRDTKGYQINGIPVNMKPKDDKYKGETEREITICFDKMGVITDVNIGLDYVSRNKIIGMGYAVNDLMLRRTILRFIENLRDSYYEKDLPTLNDIFCDQSIVLSNDIKQKKYVEDRDLEMRYGNFQYLKDVRRLFNMNESITVEFDDIKIERHPTHSETYGVSVHQKMRCGNQTNDGKIIMIWNFSNPETPVIPIRIWRPEGFQMDNSFIIE